MLMYLQNMPSAFDVANSPSDGKDFWSNQTNSKSENCEIKIRAVLGSDTINWVCEIIQQCDTIVSPR